MARDKRDLGRQKSVKSQPCNTAIVFREKKFHPPFNSGVPIDVKRGMHPKLSMNVSCAPPPGSYDPIPMFKKFCNHIRSWKREEEMKEFAATMGGRLTCERLIDRDLMKSGLGPGTHDLKQWPETILDKNLTTQTRDTGFGVAPRFQRSKSSRDTPGPGYTGKDHNPFYHLDRNRLKSENSCLSSFEFDGFLPRSITRNDQSLFIAPNRYNPQHPECLEKFLKKVTGKRGPYDLFTGPRNATTLYGYVARSKTSNYQNWPIVFPSEFEKAFGGSNRYKGIWTESSRFAKKPTVRSMLEDVSLCYKNPDWPGPGFYDPVLPCKRNYQSKHPFDDSVKNARPLRPWEISPGPGTYDLIKARKGIPGNGWTWTFKSKVQRRIGPKPDPHNSF